jgi:hypothetical protein
MHVQKATQRTLSAHVSSVRRTAIRTIAGTRIKDQTIYRNMELDSHADTVVLGNNCVIVSFTGRECDVSPYIESYDSIKGVPIVTGATAWTSDRTGETLILVFHEAIWMGDVMDHSLVNPIQLCHNGVEVQDNPYSLSEMRIASESNDVIIPHTASGTTTHFPSRTPTDRELQTCRHVYLTSQSEWNPHQVRFPEPLQRIKDLDARALKQVRIDPFNLASHACGDEHCDCSNKLVTFNPHELVERMISVVRVDDMPPDVPMRRTFVSKERHVAITAAELSERWCIGLTQVTNTIRVTTQNGTRSTVLPLSRRYRADRVFERPLLRGQFYTDTVDGRTKSLNGNRYAQVFATKDSLLLYTLCIPYHWRVKGCASSFMSSGALSTSPSTAQESSAAERPSS